MLQKRWPILVIIILLLCLALVLCLGCAAVAWFWIRSVPSSGIVPIARSIDGGTLRLFGSEPRTLDPALVEDATSAEYVVEIFGGLVTLNEKLEVVPDLAERWAISSDGKTYTFFLQEGARFHDGRPVTAADFKYSLERACDPHTGSIVAEVYLGDIVGAKEKLTGQADEIRGVEVLDERTLRITIDAPKAYFLAKLTYSTAFVLDQKNVEQPDWLKRPNGTGPFKLQEYSKQRIVLQRNEYYHRGKPKLAQVVFVLAGGSPMSMYENGELDITGVGPADIERVRDPTNPLHAELTIIPQLDIQYLGFDVRQPPFDDVKIRQAFNLALDRQKICDVVWKGMRMPAQGIVPPGMPGYKRENSLLSYDPQRARQLIAESQYGNAASLLPITLSISGREGQLPSYMKAIVAMYYENLGIEIAVEQSENILAGEPQFFSLGWIADYPDPEDFLDILFHSQSGLNRMHYANPQVDRLLEEARIETDTERRMQLYRQVEEIIVTEAPWVPLWHSVDYVLTKPYVKGAVYAPAIFPWLANVYIEK
ncbi:MAG: peptide ABC transporter substrate-binding protein [Anaerolineae bacterium]